MNIWAGSHSTGKGWTSDRGIKECRRKTRQCFPFYTTNLSGCSLPSQGWWASVGSIPGNGLFIFPGNSLCLEWIACSGGKACCKLTVRYFLASEGETNNPPAALKLLLNTQCTFQCLMAPISYTDFTGDHPQNRDISEAISVFCSLNPPSIVPPNWGFYSFCRFVCLSPSRPPHLFM